MSNVAIVQEGFVREDPLSTLKVVELPIPKAGAGQVVVHVKLRPILPLDTIALCHSGVHNGTPGCEGFGIVHEVGEGVTKFHKGQRVVPHTAASSLEGKGSWQQYICLAEEYVWPVPDAMSDEQAAQFVINPWTSYAMMKSLQPVPRGEYILQTAAGSTVGKQVISLANQWGLQTINIVRRPEQKAELQALGHQVICSSEEDVVTRVKEITAGRGGAWAALDAVGGAMTQSLASCVRDGGRVIVYANLGGGAAVVNVFADLFRGVSVTGFNGFSNLKDTERREAYAAEVAPLVIDSTLPVADVEKFDLTDFKRAMARAAEPYRSRKVLLASA